jgi:D,D-heptose 1,7-bisphosphate phosphatase
MGKAAVFFDRDNTLIISDGYLGDPAGVKLVRGAAEAVARCRAMGFAVVTISNQSGVARGMFDEEAVKAVNQRMDELLTEGNADAVIDRHEYCPFHPEGVLEEYRKDSDLRKPKPGMLFRAAEAMDLDLRSSWVIGDAPRDIEAGHAAGCRTILLEDPALMASPATIETSSVDPDETVTSLAEAVDIIQAADSTEAAIAPSVRSAREFVPNRPMRSPPGLAAEEMTSQDVARLHHTAQQILDHLKRRTGRPADFSLSQMVAGVTQTLALGFAIGSYFYRYSQTPLLPILVAIFLQALTATLILMSRDK